MSILIKGIDIPKCCNECTLKYSIKCKCYIGYHHKDTSRANKCPIIVEPKGTPLPKGLEVLDKIRAEIEQTANEEQKYDEKWAIGLRYAIKILDKYKTGSEV